MRHAPLDRIALANARRLRQDQGEAERRIWGVLRDRQLAGLKFRRQMPIGAFIVDFCCLSRRLVIELDGTYHEETAEHDLRREDFIRARGFRIIRFECSEVIET